MEVAEFTVKSSNMLEHNFMWGCVGHDHTFVLNLPEQPFWDDAEEIELRNDTDTSAVIIVNFIELVGAEQLYGYVEVTLSPNEYVTIPMKLVFKNGVKPALPSNITLVL